MRVEECDVVCGDSMAIPTHNLMRSIIIHYTYDGAAVFSRSLVMSDLIDFIMNEAGNYSFNRV